MAGYMRERQWAAVGAALLGLVAAGCEDFAPASYLDGPRVLALVAEPPEVGPGEATTLSAHLYVPPASSSVDEGWSFCPFSAGSRAGYTCAIAACEVPLTPAEDGTVAVSPSALAADCVTLFAGAGNVPSGALPSRLETVVTYQSTTRSGTTRVAALRVPLWTKAAPSPRNRNPKILRVELRGATVTAKTTLAAARPDEELTLRAVVDPASLDTYTDTRGQQRTEVPVISVYASAGRFEHDRVEGADTTSTWRAEQLEGGQTRADLYVVARDLRGGQAVAGPFYVPITR